MTTLRNRIQLAACAAVAVACWGCSGGTVGGYTQQSMYREGIKTVAVPIWTRGKDVYRRGVEMRLTEALQKRIELDTPYKVATKTTADTQIVGRIDLIEQQVLSYDTDTGRAREKEIVMSISFKWTDLRTGKAIVDWTPMRVAATYRSHAPLNQDFFQGSEAVVNKAAKRVVEEMEKPW
jgi:hypothetical protein